jgi:CDP-diglyceride synthetase
VHWASVFSWVPLAFFNPWWLTLAFATIVIIGNAPFMVILRSNRIRLSHILTRITEG